MLVTSYVLIQTKHIQNANVFLVIPSSQMILHVVKIDDEHKCIPHSCPSDSTCVVINGKRTCFCKSGYTYNGTCVDLCSAGELKPGVCPGECRPTENGFQCVCRGKYKLSKDNVTCEERQMCQKGESGFKDCQSKNQTCMGNPKFEKGYECGKCLYGLNMYNGTCTDLCNLTIYKEFCFQNGGSCTSVNLVTGEVQCKCPPLFTYKDEIGCIFAKYSYTAPLKIPNDYQNESNGILCIDENTEVWSRIYRDVNISLSTALGSAVSKINVFNCCTEDSDVICKTEIQMNFPSQHLFSSRISLDVCSSVTDNSKSVCFLPPFLKLKKNSLTSGLFNSSNACGIEYGGSMCPFSTQCTVERFGFSCKCKKGFKVTGYPVYLSRDGKGEVQTCQDINECENENICPNGTICKNIVGDFECICKPGLVRQINALDPKISTCVEVCDTINCSHGICQKFALDSHYCECYQGYSGKFCEVLTENDHGKRSTVAIVFAILEGLVLLILIPAFIYILRRKKGPKRESVVKVKCKTDKHSISAPLRSLDAVPVANLQRPVVNDQPEQEEAIYADCEYVSGAV